MTDPSEGLAEVNGAEDAWDGVETNPPANQEAGECDGEAQPDRDVSQFDVSVRLLFQELLPFLKGGALILLKMVSLLGLLVFAELDETLNGAEPILFGAAVFDDALLMVLGEASPFHEEAIELPDADANENGGNGEEEQVLHLKVDSDSEEDGNEDQEVPEAHQGDVPGEALLALGGPGLVFLREAVFAE